MAVKIRSAAIVEIERLGFTFTEVAQYALEELDPKRRVQVRESEHYAPKDQVERYAIQMGESQFPPIIVTEDAYIVDGNTRVGAKLLRGEKFFPAIILDVAYGSATDKEKYLLDALAATLNAQNGQPLTPRERRTIVERLLRLDWKNEQIGRAIGVGIAAVTEVKQEMDAVARLRRVGVDNGHLKGASLRALGKKPVQVLNDEPFKDLASLAEQARLNATEIVTFAKQAKETGSDDGARQVVASLRTEMEDRIREQALTGASKPPVARQLRQHLGFITKFTDDAQTLVETNPDVMPQHIAALESAIAVLQSVLEAQRAKA